MRPPAGPFERELAGPEADPRRGPGDELRGGPLRRRRLRTRDGLRLAAVALVLVALGALGGYVATLFQETQYAARSELLYALETEAPTGFLREDRNLTTQAALLESRSILEPVAQANGLTEEELREKLSARVLEGTELLEVEVRDPSRDRGLQLASAVNAGWLELSNRASAERRAYLEARLAEVQGALATPGLSPRDTAGLVSRRISLTNRLDALNLAGTQARVLTGPYSAPDPVRPRPLLTAAAGALGAFLIALVVIAVLARRAIRG